MDSGATIEAMRTVVRALESGSCREKVHAIQVAQDALDAAKADALAEVERTRDFELDGASTLNVWVRNQLRLSGKQAATLVKAPSTLVRLPRVAEAAGRCER